MKQEIISLKKQLLGIPIGITKITRGLKICAIGADINKFRSMIKKKKKKHEQIILITKSK